MRALFVADGPAPNPQSMLNSLGSVVTAASSVANAQQALSAATTAGDGNVLQSAGNAAQALAVRPSPCPLEWAARSASRCSEPVMQTCTDRLAFITFSLGYSAHALHQ